MEGNQFSPSSDSWPNWQKQSAGPTQQSPIAPAIGRQLFFLPVTFPCFIPDSVRASRARPDHLSLRRSVFLCHGLLVYFVSLLSLLAAGYRRSFIGRTAGRAPWQKTENKRGFATERRSLLIGFVQSFVGLPSHGTRSFTSASRIQPGRDGIRCFGLIRFAIATTTDRLKTRQTKSKSVFIVPLPPVHRY